VFVGARWRCVVYPMGLAVHLALCDTNFNDGRVELLL